MRKTKIVCTIGPASESKENLAKLVTAGMDVMRLNFSHGDFEEHGARIQRLREICEEKGKRVAILLDTKGPEIRTMQLADGEVMLEAGQKFTLSFDQSIMGDNTRVAVTYPGLAEDLKTGDTVLLDDGLIELRVAEIHGKDVTCLVLNNGELGNKKGVNLPNVNVSLPAISEKDRGDLLFGCEQQVDFVAASFIRKPGDVLEIRELLDQNGGKDIKIIAKIESQEGVDNFDDILTVSDGIMVARGDLGVEIPVEEVIFAQKMMIKKCNEARKPVITATQMMDSMIKNPRPTRAEAGDVTNAILDGTDAVMLSGESAKGKYPWQSVHMMAQICKRTDEVMKQRKGPSHIETFSGDIAVTEAICKAASHAAWDLEADLIVVATRHGKSVNSVRKYFPQAPMLALTYFEKTARHLCLTRGVRSMVIDKVSAIDELHKLADVKALESGMVQRGQTIVLVTGALNNSTNTVAVHRL